jgi:hypothetical protein
MNMQSLATCLEDFHYWSKHWKQTSNESSWAVFDSVVTFVDEEFALCELIPTALSLKYSIGEVLKQTNFLFLRKNFPELAPNIAIVVASYIPFELKMVTPEMKAAAKEADESTKSSSASATERQKRHEQLLKEKAKSKVMIYDLKCPKIALPEARWSQSQSLPRTSMSKSKK